MTGLDILPSSEIARLFSEEIAHLGGTVADQFLDSECLIARAVLPGKLDVNPGDKVQGGVAIMATETDINVHPYLLRQVCTNGAIRVQAIETCRIARPSDIEYVESATKAFCASVRACATPEAFSAGVNEMQNATLQQADLALQLLPYFRRNDPILSLMLRRIMQNLRAENDRSVFGLMNAVTAAARDTRDPKMRWKLEEFGGGIPALALTAPRVSPPRHAVANREPVLV